MKQKGLKGGLFAGGKPKALTASESLVSKSIQSFLDTKGLYNDRLNSGKIFSVTKYFEKKTGQWKEFGRWIYLAKKGTPDRWFLIQGFMHFVEVKKRGKEATPEQIEVHELLRKAGAIVIVADSLDSFIRQFYELPLIKAKGERNING